VFVPVVHIGVVGVTVPEGFVGVLVRMGLTTIPREGVLMLMVSVVPMRVSVRQRFVYMLVLMHLGQV
jgi:hypothetical protein